MVDESAFSSSASNPDISRPSSLRDGGEVLVVVLCTRTFDGVCSSLVLHRFPNLRDVGGNKCHYVECSVFFFFSVCAPLVCDGRSFFLERIACCVKSTHKEVFVSTRTDADLSAPRG